MKAWIVREKGEFEATVVFAETRGQAKVRALYTDMLECSDFMSIDVRRAKEADKFYKPGKRELDWFDTEDRIALVKDCGFTCSPDTHCAEKCAICPAKDYCDDYMESEKAECD